VTEEHAGSDPSAIRTTARPADRGDWVIDGEKWFVTSGDVATAHVVVAVAEGHGPTLFIVDAGLPGMEIVDDPPFTHTFPHGHPTIRFRGVRVPRPRSWAARGRPTSCSGRGSSRSGWASPCTAWR
jgi:alkylation response protein AidB-like acyl-CoA dehydrogenase